MQITPSIRISSKSLTLLTDLSTRHGTCSSILTEHINSVPKQVDYVSEFTNMLLFFRLH